MDKTGIAWAAGIFEGEGTVGAWDNPPVKRYPQARVVMTDQDVIQQLHRVLPFGVYHEAKRLYGRERRLRYTASFSGFEKVQALLAMLWPWLGERRREQFRITLANSRTNH